MFTTNFIAQSLPTRILADNAEWLSVDIKVLKLVIPTTMSAFSAMVGDGWCFCF